MISIYCCCGSGLGTSLLLKMTVEEALKSLGVRRYELAFGSVSAIPYTADLIVCSRELASTIHTRIPVIGVLDLMDEEEAVSALCRHFTEHPDALAQ